MYKIRKKEHLNYFFTPQKKVLIGLHLKLHRFQMLGYSINRQSTSIIFISQVLQYLLTFLSFFVRNKFIFIAVINQFELVNTEWIR